METSRAHTASATDLSRAQKLELMMASAREADGRFLTGVLTTRIFCRPSCRARKPRPENVVFFATPAEARHAGFRPCKRCVPDGALHDRGREVLARVRRWYEASRDEGLGVAALAEDLGLSERQLRRIVKETAGCTPKAFLTLLALARAIKALTTTRETVLEIAFDSGFGSLSAFQAAFRRRYGMAPLALRRRQGESS
jgi:AraC family transcriptional regulator of adaptative response / DNA-3-methyladenine glycosylase II